MQGTVCRKLDLASYCCAESGYSWSNQVQPAETQVSAAALLLHQGVGQNPLGCLQVQQPSREALLVASCAAPEQRHSQLCKCPYPQAQPELAAWSRRHFLVDAEAYCACRCLLHNIMLTTSKAGLTSTRFSCHGISMRHSAAVLSNEVRPKWSANCARFSSPLASMC